MKKYIQNITLATSIALASLPNSAYGDINYEHLYKTRTPRTPKEIKKYENIELDIFIPEEEYIENDCIKPFNIRDDIKRLYQKFRILLDRNKQPTPASSLENKLK